MSEKTEAEEFDEEDDDELVGDAEDVDLDRVNKDLDLAKRRARSWAIRPGAGSSGCAKRSASPSSSATSRTTTSTTTTRSAS